MNRLLFITERFPPDIGGVARSADRITEALCQLGLNVDVLVWTRYLQGGEVAFPDRENTSDIESRQIYRVGRYRHWDMTLNHTMNLLDWLSETYAYDAVWGHYLFPAGFLATWFAELNHLPCTVSARGNDIDRGIFPPGDFARLQWTLERAGLITTVSADLQKKIQCLTRRNDIFLLKNAVDTQIFSPPNERQKGRDMRADRHALGIGEDEVILGFAGELREKKGQRFLFSALSTVRQVYPACLLIIGEVRESQKPALQLYGATHPEDSDRVIVTGHLNEGNSVAQYLQLCDIFLLPSLWEGMPNALLEAMACQCCCIASDAGGIPEAIEHGKNGFILSRSHLHHLGDAILEALQLPPENRREMGKAARDRILAEFSPAQEKARLQQVIHRLNSD